jgi:hypothetical protein
MITEEELFPTWFRAVNISNMYIKINQVPGYPGLVLFVGIKPGCS